jgi:hypothetical protein
LEKRSLKNCNVDIIPDVGLGFDARKKDIIKDVSFSESATSLQSFSVGVKKIRGFISCENLEETIVFESK